MIQSQLPLTVESDTKLHKGLSKKSYLGLAGVAFMAVFREAFEVVLFLRALLIDLDSLGAASVAVGIFSSVLVLTVLSFIIISQSRKLSLVPLFQFCSWTMITLAIILVGKGMHSLQEAGVLNVWNIPIHFRMDVLGIFPNWQTISAQLLIIIAFILLFFIERKINSKNAEIASEHAK